MSAPGWKAPNQERAGWLAREAVLLDKPEAKSLQTKAGQDDPAPARYLSRMSVRSGDKIVLVPLDEVLWIQSHGNLLRLHLENVSYDHRMTLKDLHRRLDPERFLRVHRGAIVNLDHVVEFELPRSGNALVHLRNGTALPVSRVARLRLRRGLFSQAYTAAL